MYNQIYLGIINRGKCFARLSRTRRIRIRIPVPRSVQAHISSKELNLNWFCTHTLHI